MNSFMPEEFNMPNKFSMYRWLAAEKPDEEAKARMHLLGNIVVPQCADLAGDLLLRQLRAP